MSKGFTFTLEAALRQRVHQEQEIQIALARLVAGHGEALAHLDHLDGLRVQAHQAAETGTALDPEARMNALYYLDRCAHVVEQQRGIVAQWEQEVQRVRALLVDASRRRRGLEKLRERRRQEFEVENQRRAALQLDELVTMRHARTMAEREQGYATHQ